MGTLRDDLVRRAAIRSHDPDATTPLRVIRDQATVRGPDGLDILITVTRQPRLSSRATQCTPVDLERAAPIGHEDNRVSRGRELGESNRRNSRAGRAALDGSRERPKARATPARGGARLRLVSLLRSHYFSVLTNSSTSLGCLFTSILPGS